MTIAVISMIRDSWGGSEELWYQMAKKALGQNHTIIHLCYENPVRHKKKSELIEKGLIEITRPGWIPANAGGFKKIIYLGFNFLRKKIKDPIRKIATYKPDIIIYNGTAYSVFNETSLLGYLQKSKSVKFFIIGHFNNDLIRDITDRQAEQVKQFYKRAQQVLFVSERNRNTAERHLAWKIPNAKIIRNPVNLDETGILHYPKEDGIYRMAMVGNLVTIHKGHDLLFQALSSKLWKERNWQLNIYGEGEDKTYLNELIKFLDLQNRIILHGKTGNIKAIWQQNQLLLMPSLMEGMPLAVVEAMLCGRACVATDVGGITEWIEDNKSGFIAASASVKCIEETMERAWQQRNNWQEMGAEAYARAIQLYDTNAGETLLNIITHNAG